MSTKSDAVRSDAVQDHLTQARAALLNAQKEFTSKGENNDYVAYIDILHRQVDLLIEMIAKRKE